MANYPTNTVLNKRVLLNYVNTIDPLSTLVFISRIMGKLYLKHTSFMKSILSEIRKIENSVKLPI